MSVLDDENYIATRMAQIAAERAEAMGIARPDAPPKTHHTGGLVTAPPGALMGSVFFGRGNMYLYGSEGTAQIQALGLIMMEIFKRQTTKIRLQGYAQAGEEGIDTKSSPQMLAANRQKFVRECIVTGMAFTGTVIDSQILPGHIVTPGFISPESHCRRVDIFAVD